VQAMENMASLPTGSEDELHKLQTELIWNFTIFSITVFLVAVAAVSLGLNLVSLGRFRLFEASCLHHEFSAPVTCSSLQVCQANATATFDVLWMYQDHFVCSNVSKDEWISFVSTYYNTIWHPFRTGNMFILNMVNGIDRLYNTVWLVFQVAGLKSIPWMRRARVATIAVVGGHMVFLFYPGVVLYLSYQSENYMYSQGELKLGSEWIAILVLAAFFVLLFSLSFRIHIRKNRAELKTEYKMLQPVS
jgi:hypothetical protein